MRKLITYISILLSVLANGAPAHAQAMWALLFGKKIHNDKLSLGIHIGLEASNLTETEDKYLTGLAFGAYTNIRLSPKLSLSNYFIFKSPRGASEIPIAYQLKANVQNAGEATLKRKLTYMEISPLMRYGLTPELSIAVGPQIALRTVAKDVYRWALEDGGRQTVVYKIKDQVGWFDLDAAADIQYAFYGGKGVRLNLRFSQGLINVYKDQVPFSARNQYFQLGVGIPIAIGVKE